MSGIDPASRDIAERGRAAAVPLGLAALALLLHAPTRATVPDGFDSADFVLAMRDFDVSRLQPHFPGYPVYVVLARALHGLTGLGEVECLSLVGIGLAAMAASALVAIGRRLAGEGGAGFLAMLWIVAPLAWLQAVRPTSDAAGASVLLVAAAMLLPRRDERVTPAGRLVAGAGMLGLGLGVRPSLFPFVSLLVAAALHGTRSGSRLPRILRGAGGLAAGLLAWILPLVAHEGGATLLREGFRFVRGHFGRWGGAGPWGGAGGPATMLSRASRFGGDAVDGGFGGLWPPDPRGGVLAAAATALGIAAVAVGIARILRAASSRTHGPCTPPSPDLRLAAWATGVYALPYGVWILLAQNPAEPRHVLPLLPAAGIVAWIGLPPRRRAARPLLAGILLAAALAAAVPRLEEYHALAPATRLAQRLATLSRQHEVRLYGGSAARVLQVLDPGADARLARDLQSARWDLGGSLVRPAATFFAGPAPLRAAGEGAPRPVECLEADPMVFGKEARLALWRIEGESRHDGP